MSTDRIAHHRRDQDDAGRSRWSWRAGLAGIAACTCLALSAPALASGATAASAPGQDAARSEQPPRIATGATQSGPLIAVDELKVWAGEEQDWNQNGDEPVVVNLMIRTTLGEKGSTRTAWVSEKPRELGSGVDYGDWVHVPDDQGDAHFSASKPAIGGGTMAVRYLSYDDVMAAYEEGRPLPADMVMVVSFAFDGDFSGQSALMDFMNAVRRTVVAKMTPVFESAAVPVDVSAMPDAVKKVSKAMDSVSFGVWDVLSNIDDIWSIVWKSGGDYDDLIGLSVAGYVPVERDFVDWLPVDPQDVGFDRNWTRDATPRVTIGDGWLDVPARLGLLSRDGATQGFVNVVQSDLPIEDHVGYDLRYHVNPNRG